MFRNALLIGQNDDYSFHFSVYYTPFCFCVVSLYIFVIFMVKNGDNTKEFCSQCSDADLCHLLTDHLVEVKQPIRGIEILKKAIRKIQLFDSQLTSIHADLCQLCLLSKCLKPALDFLDTDVTGIGSEVSEFLTNNPYYVQFNNNTYR